MFRVVFRLTSKGLPDTPNVWTPDTVLEETATVPQREEGKGGKEGGIEKEWGRGGEEVWGNSGQGPLEFQLEKKSKPPNKKTRLFTPISVRTRWTDTPTYLRRMTKLLSDDPRKEMIPKRIQSGGPRFFLGLFSIRNHCLLDS